MACPVMAVPSRAEQTTASCIERSKATPSNTRTHSGPLRNATTASTRPASTANRYIERARAGPSSPWYQSRRMGLAAPRAISVDRSWITTVQAVTTPNWPGSSTRVTIGRISHAPAAWAAMPRV